MATKFSVRVKQGHLVIREKGTSIMTCGADGSCVAIAGKLINGGVFCAHVDIGIQTNSNDLVKKSAIVVLGKVLDWSKVTDLYYAAGSRQKPTPGLIDGVKELCKGTSKDMGVMGDLGLDDKGIPCVSDKGETEWDCPKEETEGTKCTVVT